MAEQFIHPTSYRFYLQKYPQGDTTFTKTDIEEAYNCRYMCFTDFAISGDVKNIYQEDYSESSAVRTYIPEQKDLAYKSYDCNLKLLFRHGDVQARVRQFTNDYMGVKVEYSDTFRNRHATLLMTKTPKIETEKLYGDTYMVVQFTFTNILGTTYTESKL